MLDKITLHNQLRMDTNIKQEVDVPKVREVIPIKEELPEQHPSKKQTEKVINSMNDFLTSSQSHLKFEYHEGLEEYFVTLIDDNTNQVLREIPSKKLLDMYAAMSEYLGHLIDRKA
ncbi:flagellar protein FlaG [Bacillus sp. EB01]|uniref:flagellar protein FlaG n=1 Tax=Bacillus sp. EB01 TaxID=1347086 RepID=UPI0005C5CE4E|nr:flagellar protein FlaG [Bacillus sp. EB01]